MELDLRKFKIYRVKVKISPFFTETPDFHGKYSAKRITLQ